MKNNKWNIVELFVCLLLFKNTLHLLLSGEETIASNNTVTFLMIYYL